MSNPMSKTLLWCLLSVVIIIPFSNDIFIPAFPIMKQVFNTLHISWVISLFLLGLACSQLFYGPFSDRFGRKPVLVIGLFIFILGATITLLAYQFPLFLLGRFIQAIGACSTIVSVLAIIRDTQRKTDIVRSIGIIMAVIGISPAIAPLIGSFLTNMFNWRTSFVFLLCLGVFYFIFIMLFFRETQETKNLQALQLKHVLANYRSLIKNKRYGLYCLVSALSYGVLFTYISLSSIYIIELFHYSLMTFSMIFLFLSLIIFGTSLAIPKLSLQIGLLRTMILGIMFITLGAACMLISNMMWSANVYTLCIPMAITIIGIGIIRPTATAGAMSQATPSLSGSASAGYNFCTFVGGSVCSALSGLLHRSPLDFSVFILLMSFIASGTVFINLKLKKPKVLTASSV